MDDRELSDELHVRFYYRDGKFFYKRHCGSAGKGSEAGTREPENGGVVMRIHRVTYQRGRLVWLYHHGVLPYRNIKHINGKNWDDSIENLYQCTGKIQVGKEPKTRIKAGHL